MWVYLMTRAAMKDFSDEVGKDACWAGSLQLSTCLVLILLSAIQITQYIRVQPDDLINFYLQVCGWHFVLWNRCLPCIEMMPSWCHITGARCVSSLEQMPIVIVLIHVYYTTGARCVRS